MKTAKEEGRADKGELHNLGEVNLGEERCNKCNEYIIWGRDDTEKSGAIHAELYGKIFAWTREMARESETKSFEN